tara:strand:+ start:89 stop:370 length:282 start_codon:yes stop_codon:yes gene_type:complete
MRNLIELLESFENTFDNLIKEVSELGVKVKVDSRQRLMTLSYSLFNVSVQENPKDKKLSISISLKQETSADESDIMMFLQDLVPLIKGYELHR